jgi:FkbM family methyltransferase
MNFLAKLARRIQSLDEFIKQPHQIVPRGRGVQLDLYRSCNNVGSGRCDLRCADIGANEGQFAWAARCCLARGADLFVRTTAGLLQQLNARFKGVSGFAAFNIGLGDQQKLTFQQNQFSASSSFLKMAPAHTTEFPHTQGARAVTVRLERLDDVADKLVLRAPLLIKIDVQGYEDKVIAGGERTFQRADLVIVESSFEVLYEGQPLFDDIYQRLVKLGFVFRGALDQTMSTKDGRPLQADSVFVRSCLENQTA